MSREIGSAPFLLTKPETLNIISLSNVANIGVRHTYGIFLSGYPTPRIFAVSYYRFFRYFYYILCNHNIIGYIADEN